SCTSSLINQLMPKHRHSLTVLFFFNETPTTEIYTLSLHDALPIFGAASATGTGASNLIVDNTNAAFVPTTFAAGNLARKQSARKDRKSTRLNSSHVAISYAVFCLKKKKSSRSTIRVTRARRCALSL